MDAVLSSSRKMIVLHHVACLIVLAAADKAKIKGTFKCTTLPIDITCSTVNLPNVTDGSFDCAPNTDVSKDEACTLTCNDGFYTASSDQAVCEAGSADQGGMWSKGNYACLAIACSTANLPTVTNGSFDCVTNTDQGVAVNQRLKVSMGEACNLTCNEDFYPASSDQAVCVDGPANHGGEWSNGNFNCLRTPNGKLSLNSQLKICNQWLKWNSTEYKFVQTPQHWTNSRLWCENNDAHLVSIENEEENYFIFKLTSHCSNITNRHGSSWIGLNDIEAEGIWKWSKNTSLSYEKWDMGQPNGGSENCVIIFYDGKENWHDAPCRWNLPYICETNTPPLNQSI